MELQRRGVTAFLVASRVFEPLVKAQARVVGVLPPLIIVDHPIGGLNADELIARISEGYGELVTLLGGG